jgi:hypothetical protein
MSQCPSCNQVNETGTAFCQNCGASLAGALPPAATAPVAARAGGVGGVERGLFFKISRVAAWVLLVVALGGMLVSALGLLPALASMNASADDVTAKDVRAQVEAARNRSSAPSGDNPFGSGSASERAALDKAIYELADVMPPQAIGQFGNLEGFRSVVKGLVDSTGETDIDDQVDHVEEATKIVGPLPDEDRISGVYAYFHLVSQHKQEAEVRQLEAKGKATVYAGAFAMAAVTLMLVTMTLVLLAIERNTRGHAE